MRIILTICFLYLCLTTAAQSTYRIGFLPSVSLNKKLSNEWQAKFKVEFRQSLKKGAFKDDNAFNYEYILTDFNFMMNKKIGSNYTFAGGYTFRWKGEQLIHRTIQQVIFGKKHTNFKSAHRLSADQTFAKAEPATFRLRYKATLELPLKGSSVEAKEFYLKISNEYLNILEDKVYELEIRVIPLLGYKFNEKNKAEFGIDYRVDSFINGDSRNLFWTSLNWTVVL